uniref:Odorant binding protein 11 n=1 Tax=Colaphellus bowringi TaxID=561076 RepID=A0A0S3J2H1_9CUCU|nr:odorant binding protein 11 [Colaphellus bowringi]
MKTILKYVILIGVSSTYAYITEEGWGEPLIALANSLHNKCVPITGVTQASIDQVKEGNFIEDEKMKRYVLCLWLVSEVISEKFELNTEIFKLLPKKLQDGHNIIGCTKKINGTDVSELYEKTYSVTKCIQKANPDEFIMF